MKVGDCAAIGVKVGGKGVGVKVEVGVGLGAGVSFGNMIVVGVSEGSIWCARVAISITLSSCTCDGVHPINSQILANRAQLHKVNRRVNKKLKNFISLYLHLKNHAKFIGGVWDNGVAIGKVG